MSKTRIFAIVLILFVIVGVSTNPPKEEIDLVLNQKATHIIKQQLGYKETMAVDLAMQLFGNKIIDELVANNVVVENYFLCSVIKIKWSGEETWIGVAAFKNVWLSSKVDEKVDEIIKVLKAL